MVDVSENAGWLIAALLVGTWLISVGVRWLHSRFVLWGHHRRFRVARRGERDAVHLLRRHGFDVVGSQVDGSWTVWVDDEPLTVNLCVDHLVSRDGRRYAAEVKTGRKAPSVRRAKTRRQLLEYFFAFDVDGVILVDMERHQLRHVEFDIDSRG